MEDVEFHPGDHLLISCEPHQVEVVRADRAYVYVRWPWLRPDPESKVHWDGTHAFARDPKDYDSAQLWRLDPPPSKLKRGDLCQLSIPPTEVVVTWAARFDPPKDIGWLPRPVAALNAVLVFGDDRRPGEEAGQGLYLHDADPLVIERLGELP